MPGQHTARQKRQASHIEASAKQRGYSPARAKQIAWATVNKQRSHSTVSHEIQQGTSRTFPLPGGAYKVVARVDPYRGGYEAVLVSIGVGVLMHPNGETPKAAIAQLVRELRLFGDKDLAHQIVEATRGV